jgi:hypothetical protein
VNVSLLFIFFFRNFQNNPILVCLNIFHQLHFKLWSLVFLMTFWWVCASVLFMLGFIPYNIHTLLKSVLIWYININTGFIKLVMSLSCLLNKSILSFNSKC